MFDFLGICLALAALLTVNALVSLLTLAGWRVVSPLVRNLNAATRARLIFALRIFPATTAFLVVTVFLIPSYLVFEPRQTGEIVSFKLGLLALFSVTGIILALWRGMAAGLATRKLVSNWLAHSETLQLEEISIPAYRIEHPFPVVAVVGVLRPKLFVAGQIFDSLNTDELTAVIRHETAHVAAWDNLKHWIMRICRDVLVIVPVNRSFDKEWSEAIELAADEKAVGRGKGAAALDLAQALIKIARIIPAGAKPVMPAGAFLIGSEVESGDALARRVRRLAQLSDEKLSSHKNKPERLISFITWVCFVLLFLVVGITATNSDVLAALHAGLEKIVAILS